MRTPTEQLAEQSGPLQVKNVITFVMIVCSICIALVVHDLGAVLSVVGATGSTIITYILPGECVYCVRACHVCVLVYIYSTHSHTHRSRIRTLVPGTPLPAYRRVRAADCWMHHHACVCHRGICFRGVALSFQKLPSLTKIE
jgi:hypothetical protein